MGMFKRKSHQIQYQNSVKETSYGNPDPNRFKIIAVWEGDLYYACKVYYPDCINYEGMKYLVCKKDPRLFETFDPHFEEDGNILARLEPTDLGWSLAKAIANNQIF